MSEIGLQPYRDIIRDVANAPESVWHRISKDWYNSLLSEAEKLSISKTCETCKWWDRESDLVFSGCGGECTVSKSRTFRETLSGMDIPKDWIQTDFTDSEQPMFITGPEFGCIHWEPK